MSNTWAESFQRLAELEAEEWDDMHELLREQWKAEYSAAFIRIAVDRGWKEEDARTWPDEIWEDAFSECYAHEFDPVKIPAIDVIEAAEGSGLD